MKELWEERYLVPNYVYGTKPNTWFKQFIDTHTPGKILMPAEGEGRNAVYAASKGWQVSAFDLTDAGRHKAMRLASEAGVTIEYITGDAMTIQYPENQFDALAIVFLHLPEDVRRIIFQRLTTFVKPGGHVVLECFDKRHFGNNKSGPKTIDLLYSPIQLQGYFNSLKMLVFEEANYEIDEGPLHQGPAAVIRMLGEKVDSTKV